MDHGNITLMLTGVIMACRVPITGSQHLIAQGADVRRVKDMPWPNTGSLSYFRRSHNVNELLRRPTDNLLTLLTTAQIESASVCIFAYLLLRFGLASTLVPTSL